MLHELEGNKANSLNSELEFNWKLVQSSANDLYES